MAKADSEKDISKLKTTSKMKSTSKDTAKPVRMSRSSGPLGMYEHLIVDRHKYAYRWVLDFANLVYNREIEGWKPYKIVDGDGKETVLRRTDSSGSDMLLMRIPVEMVGELKREKAEIIDQTESDIKAEAQIFDVIRDNKQRI